ncbi:MAG: Serine protease AprX [Calditrichaeota bacterium]|nr:Serine protease AprX [Calditrichota bacterium]
MRAIATIATVAALMLLLFAGPQAASDALSAPKSYRIDMPVRTFTPDAEGPAYLDSRDARDGQAVLIQFAAHPTNADKGALSRRGVRLQQYVGGGAWIAWLAEGVSARSVQGMQVRWAGPLRPGDRIAPRVVNEEIPSWAEAGDEILISVQFVKEVSESRGEAILQGAGVSEVGDYISILNVWYAQVPPSLARELAEIEQVLAIDYIAPPMDMINEGVRAALRVDELYDPPLELRGAGSTVCVYDGGMVDANHPDFEDRVTIGENGGVASHATHVAGTVGGNGAPNVRGMAPECTIISYEYEQCVPYCLYDSPQDIFENYEEAWLEHGARIFTNSIGANIYANGYPCEWQGDYELTSALVDSIVRGAVGAPVIIGFAAGNENPDWSPCGTGYETMTVPAGAKNIITVGASDDFDNIASFSSWGPPDDGRVKPTVTAPGVDVVSCNAGGGYTTMSGTSMATPAIAGVNALLIEAWGRWAISDFPMPATIKAILANSAEDLGEPGPDYVFGFGRGDAVRSVEAIQNFGYLEAQVGDNGSYTHEFNVPAGMDAVKVTAAWSDPPAPYLPPITLINDLDITLEDPDGTTWQPYVLDPDNPGAPAAPGTNTLDVVEQVEVENPASGQWSLTVTGTDVPVGPQSFSVAANVPLAEGVMTISGVVTDANSGAPIEGAFVGLEGAGGGRETNENGEYFMYLPVSEITAISADHVAYEPQRAYVLPDEDGEATIDFQLSTSPTGTISGRVFDPDGEPVAGADVSVVGLPQYATVTGEFGFFALVVPASNYYQVRAEAMNLEALAEAYVPEGENRFLQLTLMSTEQRATGPDLHGYIAVQSGDQHPMAPEYDWVEIDPDAGGPGTRIELTEEEQPVVVELPFEFSYYGRPTDVITVNENGFFCFGDVTPLGNDIAADYSNSPIPDDDGPPALVGPFWEDFRAVETNLSYWYDEANGRFIVEWYDSRQWPVDATYETFQVQIYEIYHDLNPEFYLPSDLDGRIVFQYNDIEDLGNATVGIEAPSEEDGVQILYFSHDGDGSVAPTAVMPTDESAIVFYRPTAVVAGHAYLNPENPDVDIEIRSPRGRTYADNNGLFVLPLKPGATEMTYQAPGYERLVRGVEVADWHVAMMPDVTLWQLQPPSALTFEVQDQTVVLDWSAPEFGGQEIDEFLDQYRVYKQGLQVAQVGETSWTDENPDPNALMYWVTAMYDGGESDSSNHAEPGFAAAVGDGLAGLPDEYEISQAYPNPFNPATSLRIALPEAAPVRIAVFDVLGREVAQLAGGEKMQPGYHRFTWRADEHASGVYFVTVNAGPESAVRKIVLLK